MSYGEFLTIYLIATAGLMVAVSVSAWMTARILRNIRVQAAYDAEMYRHVRLVVEDLISRDPQIAEPLELAHVEITQAERTARHRASRRFWQSMRARPSGVVPAGGDQ